MVNVKITWKQGTTTAVLLVILVSAGLVFEYKTDETVLKQDGNVLGRYKWVVNAERTWSAIKYNYQEDRCIDKGGDVRTYASGNKRCYYPDDYYENLKRSILGTDLWTNNLIVGKDTPYFKYGTRGAYAGVLSERSTFKDTTQVEEFPSKYDVFWEPEDTRNYILEWRIYDIQNQPYANGVYDKCSFRFGKLRVNLPECEKVVISGDSATFYLPKSRGNQVLSPEFVDPSYYISYNNGLDSNDGSSGSPVKTIAKLNTLTSTGDTVYFECGSQWSSPLDDYVDVKNNMKFYSYGTCTDDNKPMIKGSFTMNDDRCWNSSIGGNIWWFNCTDEYKTLNIEVTAIFYGTDNLSALPAENAYGDLGTQGEHWWSSSSNKLYMYSTSNPTTAYGTMEITEFQRADKATGKTGVFSGINADGVTVDGLDVGFGARHGIIFGYGSEDITVNNCTVHHHGSNYNTIDSGGQGNCIEYEQSLDGIITTNNLVYECWDACMSDQAFGTDDTYVLNNIYYGYNIAERCGYGYEHLNYQSVNSEYNKLIEHNTFSPAGGLFEDIGGDTGRCFILASTPSNTGNISYRDNWCVNYNLMMHNDGATPSYNRETDLGIDYNWYADNYSDFYKERYTSSPIYTFAQFQSNLGYCANCVVSNDVSYNTTTWQPDYNESICYAGSDGEYIGAVPCAPAFSPPEEPEELGNTGYLLLNYTYDSAVGSGSGAGMDNTGLLLWFEFDSDDYPTATDTMGNYDGVFDAYGPAWIDGGPKPGYVRFTNDYQSINVSQADGGLKGLSQLTLSLLVNITSCTTANEYHWISGWTGGNPGQAYAFRYDCAGEQLDCIINTTTNSVVVHSVDANMEDDEWHHTACTWNGTSGDIKIYVNGTQIGAAGSATGTLPSDTNDVLIGLLETGEFPRNATDEFMIWERALTADEISTLNSSLMAGEDPFESAEDNTGVVEDFSGQGNNGTAYSADILTDALYTDGYILLDGKNDWVNVSGFNLNYLDSFTVETEFNAYNWSYKTLVDITGQFRSRVDAGNTTICRVYDTEGSPCTSPQATIVPGTWYKQTCVFWDNNIYQFLNESLQGYTECGSGVGSAQRPLHIGVESPTANVWNGTIDNTLIWAGVNISDDMWDKIQLDYGLVLNYTFDPEIDGIAVDSSGQGNNGTITDAVYTNYGAVQKGMSFDGDGDKIGILSDLSLRPTEFTIMAWVKGTGSYSSSYPHVIKFGAVHRGYGLAFNGGTAMSLTIGDGSSTENIGCGSLDVSYYRFVVGTYNGTHGTLYIDGIYNNSAAKTLNYVAPDNVYIGNRKSDDRYWNGTIDQVKIWNRSLTATEISDLYDKQYAESCTAPEDWAYNPSNISHRFSFDGGTEDHITGITGTNQGAESVTGKFGKAYYFDADTKRRIEYSPMFTDELKYDLSWSFWVNFSSVDDNNDHTLIAETYNGGFGNNRGYWLMWKNTSQNLLWGFADGSGREYESCAYDLITNTGWHNIIITFDSGTVKTYIDGEQECQSSSSKVPINFTGTDEAIIGEQTSSSSAGWRGSLDEIQIWDKVLSADEAYDVYKAGSHYTGPWTMWHSCDITEDAELDGSGIYIGCTEDTTITINADITNAGDIQMIDYGSGDTCTRALQSGSIQQ